jgi:two-component system, NtrC family, response regulator GlrR
MARILIIDDHPALCDLLLTVLAARGHAAFAAHGGAEGLRLFRREQPDLVITDLNMPSPDGLGVLARLQREHPEVPLIVMSGSFGDDTRYYQQVADRYGAVGVLHKPFHLSAFWQAVNSALRALRPPADSTSPFAAVPELIAI